LDYFGGMMFKKYWGGGPRKQGFPRKSRDYIFVRHREQVEVEALKSKVEASAQKPHILNFLFPNFNFLKTGVGFLLCVFSCLFAGCRMTPLTPVNLQEGGWTVREGQAVWKRTKDAPEIAGDVLVATRGDGKSFVQFTKTPFPMIIAQTTTNRWQVEIPMQNKRYSGPGAPPKRLIWAYLPGLLAGESPPKGWSWNRLPENGWRLENSRTGEMLQGYLSPPGK
jgi:hypothetical protein